MFNSITCQIKKLDLELDGCKRRLNALKVSQVKGKTGVCFQTKVKNGKRSRSAMNRRKKMQAERDSEMPCSKHQKPTSDRRKTGTSKTKGRSRSVSCCRDFECECKNENNYQHNDLIFHKEDRHLSHKNSWANILKEHNNNPRVTSNEQVKSQLENNKLQTNPSLIYLKNRGVQCSQASFVPSKTVSSMTGFTPYNPTRTLQFLMSEIRENLKYKREDKVLNIINDMEDTLHRLKSNHDNLPSYNQNIIPNHPYQEQPINKNIYPTQDVNKVFEDGFARLETSCKTLEITCARLKEENTQLQLELQKKDATISILEIKEKDNVAKIDLLNKHIANIGRKEDQYSESIKDLNKLLLKVQQENRVIQPLKEINSQLDAKLSEMVKVKDGYMFENQVLKLENEKLKVLLEIKGKQLDSYKDIFFGLDDKVRKEVKVVRSRCVSEASDPDSSAPLCSSPNTSASIMAPAYGSWRGMSRVSSNADGDAHPIPRYPSDFEIPRPDDLASKNWEKPICPYAASKASAFPYNGAIHVQVNSDILPQKQPLDGIEGIRGQIKKLFSDDYSQMKVPSHDDQNHQVQWKNLNTLHSSGTSYNTTT